MLGTIQSVSGQETFDEDTLDGIYRGLQEAIYYKQKHELNVLTIKALDSVILFKDKQILTLKEKEDALYMRIENKDAQIKLGLEIEKKQKAFYKKKQFTTAVVAFGAGIVTGIAVYHKTK